VKHLKSLISIVFAELNTFESFTKDTPVGVLGIDNFLDIWDSGVLSLDSFSTLGAISPAVNTQNLKSSSYWTNVLSDRFLYFSTFDHRSPLSAEMGLMWAQHDLNKILFFFVFLAVLVTHNLELILQNKLLHFPKHLSWTFLSILSRICH